MLAVIGMAAVVGSGTGAAMTAILMIFEMTRDYAAVVPSIVAVAVALGVFAARCPTRTSTPSSSPGAAITFRASAIRTCS